MKGIHYDSSLIREDRIAALPNDHIDRHPPTPTRLANPIAPNEPWLEVDTTYPDQIRERYRIVAGAPEWVIARMPGEDVALAEKELLDTVVTYFLDRHPEDFTREGDVVRCHLTGFAINVKEADPLVALALLATEDLTLMLPAETVQMEGGETQIYRLKTGNLVFANGWSLTSQFNRAAPADPEEHAAWLEEKQNSEAAARLGRSMREIHDPNVPHYMKHFADKADRFISNMPENRYFWRRNWSPSSKNVLFRHADSDELSSPDFTADFWHAAGYVRSEHETLVKLPQSKAVVFSIKTYIWPVKELLKHPAFMDALEQAFDNMPPLMFQYREESLPSFGEMLKTVRAGKPVRTQAPKLEA